MLNHADAQTAMDQVVGAYKAWIPKDVLDDLETRSAETVFQFLDDAEYAVVFEHVYNSTFKAANAALFGANVITAAMCPGFCTPKTTQKRKMIFMAKGRGTTKGTYYHEFIHFLQHANFYPNYYVTAGMAPFQIEGVTEYLTRGVSTAVATERDGQKKYQANYLKTDAWVKSDKSNYERMLKFNFQGVATDLSAVRK
ncbi:MAG TPA: hypothetical protein VFR86_24425 [Burkholderiaceae bacterium]|nr:hypothetical protein [Burkholderiaceae bacterium]